MRFLVSRLNHSAKLSVIHHSVHTDPFIRDWYITWSLLHHLTILYRYWKLYDFKNIQYRNSSHREINWPVWEFLLRLVFKFKLTTVFQSQSWTLDPIIAKMKRMNISGFLKVWFNLQLPPTKNYAVKVLRSILSVFALWSMLLSKPSLRHFRWYIVTDALNNRYLIQTYW